MKKLEDEILDLVYEYGFKQHDRGWTKSIEVNFEIDNLLVQIREKIHDLVLQVDHSNLVVEAAKEKIEELSKAEVKAEPVAWAVAYNDYSISFAGGLFSELGAYEYAKHVGGTARAVPLFAAPQAQPADALDTERLDWILRQGDEFSCYVIQDAPGDGDYWVTGMKSSGQHKDPRAAIDAAMAAAQEQKP